jgi:hypothetical protein
VGAYATPPGDINAKVPASGMPGTHSIRTVIWNKELTTGRSDKRPIGLHRRNAATGFVHHFRAGACVLRNAVGAAERFIFPRQSIRLRGLSATAMMSIGIFDWTSMAPMPIVIWCNATCNLKAYS